MTDRFLASARDDGERRFPKLLLDTGVERIYDEDVDRSIEVQLHDSVPEGRTTLLMARQLMDEYSCHTTSEKAVAQMAANAFARILENSRIQSQLPQYGSPTAQQVSYYSSVGKELDRATRQFDTAIGILIRMKAPPMKVNVTAKTAFVGNNQQFNTHHQP